ncbi:MAG TPA: hypothetical protein VJQ79_08835 [Acidimicrobiia bacterium]|nr:hypothetical protein [Acidimicrobiia bacterium]
MNSRKVSMTVAAMALGFAVVVTQPLQASGALSGPDRQDPGRDERQAESLARAMGAPLAALGATLDRYDRGVAGVESTLTQLRPTISQLGGLVGAFGNLARRNPGAAKAPSVAEALRASRDGERFVPSSNGQSPDLGPIREPLIPALQFFCPGFYAVSGLVLGSLPPAPGSDTVVSGADLLCDDLPAPAAPPPPPAAPGRLAYFDSRSVGEFLRFGAQSAFLPGTPLVDQGLAVTAASADSNGSAGFAAELYPGALVEAVPGVVALLGFPLTLPPLYPYIARAANPGPTSSDASIFPGQSAAAYRFDALSSKADAPRVDASRAEASALKLSQEGLIEVAIAQGTSSVEQSDGIVRSGSRTRLAAVELAGGFISIGEFVSSLSIANSGATNDAVIDRKVTVSGVKILGIPVELTDRGLVASSRQAESGGGIGPDALAKLVKDFNLEIQVGEPVVSNRVASGARIVEVMSPGLRITYRVPKDISALPVPVVQALLNNAQMEFRLGFTAGYSNVTEEGPSDTLGALPDHVADPAGGTIGGAYPSSAPLASPVESADRLPENGLSTEEFVSWPDSAFVAPVGGGADGRSGPPTAAVADPTTVALQRPAASVAPLLAMSEGARRNAYVFTLVLIALGVAIAGWRTVLYNPGPTRPQAGSEARERPGDGS